MAGMQGAKDNSKRKYPDVGGANHNPVGILVRRESAKERDELAQKRTPGEQLARLDARQCEAKRERARLTAKLKSAPTEKPAPAAENKQEKPKLKAKERRNAA